MRRGGASTSATPSITSAALANTAELLLQNTDQLLARRVDRPLSPAHLRRAQARVSLENVGQRVERERNGLHRGRIDLLDIGHAHELALVYVEAQLRGLRLPMRLAAERVELARVSVRARQKRAHRVPQTVERIAFALARGFHPSIRQTLAHGLARLLELSRKLRNREIDGAAHRAFPHVPVEFRGSAKVSSPAAAPAPRLSLRRRTLGFLTASIL